MSLVSYAMDGRYDPAKGYGLIDEQVRAEGMVPEGAELNAGFEPAEWYHPGAGFQAGQTPGLMPVCARIDVPSTGNWRLKVTLADDGPDRRYGDLDGIGLGERDYFVFDANRQLLAKGSFPADEAGPHVVSVEGVTNVADFVARPARLMCAVRHVAVAVVASHARLVSVAIEPDNETRTVWLGGDSTVTNEGTTYPYCPVDTYCGWGAMLSAWLDRSVAVANHARSGLTTATFRNEGHYDPVRGGMREGDWLLLQFGHNDQKLAELSAKGGYRDNLLRFLDEARAQGVLPVLVTPLSRNTWKDDGTYNDLLALWAGEVCLIGQEREVPVLDLHRLSMDLWCELGDKPAQPWFHAGDRTHMHDVGAHRVAGLVAGEIQRVCGSWELAQREGYRALAGHVAAGTDTWPLPARACDMSRSDQRVDQWLNPIVPGVSDAVAESDAVLPTA